MTKGQLRECGNTKEKQLRNPTVNQKNTNLHVKRLQIEKHNGKCMKKLVISITADGSKLTGITLESNVQNSVQVKNDHIPFPKGLLLRIAGITLTHIQNTHKTFTYKGENGNTANY